MNASLIFQNIGRFVFLLLIQVLVMNNLYLGGYINIFLYVLAIAMLPTNTGKIPMLLIAFASGFVVDLFSNVMGLHTCAAVVVAMMRIIFLDKILTKGEQVEISTPNMYAVSLSQYLWYLGIMVAGYNLVYFILELFSFNDFFKIVILTILSTIGTMLLAVLYQLAFADPNKPRTISKTSR